MIDKDFLLNCLRSEREYCEMKIKENKGYLSLEASYSVLSGFVNRLIWRIQTEDTLPKELFDIVKENTGKELTKYE